MREAEGANRAGETADRAIAVRLCSALLPLMVRLDFPVEVGGSDPRHGSAKAG